MIKDTVKGLISAGRLELMYVPSSSEAVTLLVCIGIAVSVL